MSYTERLLKFIRIIYAQVESPMHTNRCAGIQYSVMDVGGRRNKKRIGINYKTELNENKDSMSWIVCSIFNL